MTLKSDEMRLVAPPPPMNEPTTLASTRLFGDPPMTLGAPPAFGSNRNARPPLTCTSNAALSDVPTSLPGGVVPLFPGVRQKFAADRPLSVPAFTFVKPPPLPLKLLAGLF